MGWETFESASVGPKRWMLTPFGGALLIFPKSGMSETGSVWSGSTEFPSPPSRGAGRTAGKADLPATVQARREAPGIPVTFKIQEHSSKYWHTCKLRNEVSAD